MPADTVAADRKASKGILGSVKKTITGSLHGTGGHESSYHIYLQMPGSPGTPGSHNTGTGSDHIHPAVLSCESLPYLQGGF